MCGTSLQCGVVLQQGLQSAATHRAGAASAATRRAGAASAGRGVMVLLDGGLVVTQRLAVARSSMLCCGGTKVTYSSIVVNF